MSRNVLLRLNDYDALVIEELPSGVWRAIGASSISASDTVTVHATGANEAEALRDLLFTGWAPPVLEEVASVIYKRLFNFGMSLLDIQRWRQEKARAFKDEKARARYGY